MKGGWGRICGDGDLGSIFRGDHETIKIEKEQIVSWRPRHDVHKEESCMRDALWTRSMAALETDPAPGSQPFK